MNKHSEKSIWAGQTVKIKNSVTGYSNKEFRVEDWWDRLSGKSWMFCDQHPACINYAVRSQRAKLPIDDEVIYGKIGTLGYLFHVSELEP